MAKFIPALLIALCLAPPAQAQTNMQIACAPGSAEAFAKFMETKFGQEETRRAVSSRGTVFMLFEGPEGDYTLAFATPDGFICEVDNGTEMEDREGRGT